MTIALSIIIPAMNEAQNLARLLPQTQQVIARLGVPTEIIVVVGPSVDHTLAVAQENGAYAIVQTSRGYGGALAEGFAAAHGEWILTMDADLSHPPVFIRTLWNSRDTADLLIASRYVHGGRAVMPLSRYMLSRILNLSFPFLLSLPIRDMSSGFRLYRRGIVENAPTAGRNFDALQELLMHAYTNGWQVRELPFAYQPRGAGRSKASLVRFARSYLTTLRRMWLLRHSAECADADEHAYDSKNLLQRGWQRLRHRAVLSMAQNYIGGHILSVNCGSSRLLLDLPGTVGVDSHLTKLRYVGRYRANPLVGGASENLPFADHQFDCVLCLDIQRSQQTSIEELVRVLHPEGLLILGIRQSSRSLWTLCSWMVASRTDDARTMREAFVRISAGLHEFGWSCTQVQAVLGAEMICAFQREHVTITSTLPVGRPRELVPA